MRAASWLAVGVLLLAGCKEQLSVPTDCAVECTAGLVIRDTTIDAVLAADSSFLGYVGFNEGPSLLLSNDTALGIVHAVIRFDVTPDSLEFGGARFLVDIDSVKILLSVGARDTLVSNLRLLLYRLPIDTDSTLSFAQVESFFTPDRLIDSLIIPDSLPTGEVPLLFTGDSLARVAIPAADSGRISIGIKLHADTATAMRIGSRLTSGFGPGFLTYGHGAEGTPEPIQISFDPEPLYNGMVRGRTSTGGPDLLAVGGIPASRAIVRFQVPEEIRSQANLLRATLLLTPDQPLRAWKYEQTGLEVRPVVADLGYRSPPSSVSVGGTLMPAGMGEVAVEVKGIVSLWFQSRLISQLLYLSVTTEGAAFTEPVFRSSRSANGRPRLRLTYVLPGRPEAP